MSFDFVPRSIKKRRIGSGASTALATSSTDGSSKNLGPAQQEDNRRANNADTTAKIVLKQAITSSEAATSAKSTVQSRDSPKGPDLEQLSALVCLSLSDYAIWADVDLRRRINWSYDMQSHEDREQDNANDSPNEARGYIPLAYLFQHSPVFIQASSLASFVHYPETIYVKALRTHATQLIDVRLVLSSEENSFGREVSQKWSSGSGTQTGYEVRVKSHMQVDGRGLNEYGKSDWDRLTIYVENIPVQYRSLPGAMKFVTTLFPSSPSLAPLYSKIQNIVFLPHHRDQPSSIPTCKGFALITLSSQQDVDFLLENWPWDTAATKPHSNTQESDAKYSQALQDAFKFGFRTVSKERWEELKAEYLLFRQQLVEEINKFQENERTIRRQTHGASSISKPQPSIDHFQDRKCTHAPPKTDHTIGDAASKGVSQIHAASSYPLGCLIFVRNLHSETNKTTLRALFTQAWKDHNTTSSNSKSNDGIDYLDYMKGMDSCHIRLRTPLHAQQFVEYFSTHPTIQSSGLDSTGSPLESFQNSAKPLVVELVLGKREEVYWEKVPEKVRRQAVDKALKLMNNGAEGEERDVDDEKMSIGGKNRHKNRRGK